MCCEDVWVFGGCERVRKICYARRLRLSRYGEYTACASDSDAAEGNYAADRMYAYICPRHLSRIFQCMDRQTDLIID